MTEDLKRFLFDSALRNHFSWRRNADLLHHSALIILQRAADAVPLLKEQLAGEQTEFKGEEAVPLFEFELHKVGFFLAALAVENLLKALWVARNLQKVVDVDSQKKRLPEITTHKLSDVADKAGFALTIDERSLLDDLTKIIEWHGRYTAPTTRDAYSKTFVEGSPTNRFINGHHLFDLELSMPNELNNLISRLEVELNAIPSSSWG